MLTLLTEKRQMHEHNKTSRSPSRQHVATGLPANIEGPPLDAPPPPEAHAKVEAMHARTYPRYVHCTSPLLQAK
eukprot:2203246-Pyramimonas_sp.AAC.1